MAIFLRLCILFTVCLAVAFAVQHSGRHFESFHPAVPQVHLHNAARTAYLNYQSTVATEDSEVIALDIAAQAVGFPYTHKVKNSYVSAHNNVRHVYLRQTADDGLEILNADLNINVKNKRALNVGHTFYNGSTAAQKGQLASIEAINILSAFLKMDITGSVMVVVSPPAGIEQVHKVAGIKGAVSPANVRAGYLQLDFGKRLEPVWDIELDMNTHWWNAFVSMRTGEVLSVFDWVSDAQFNIYPIGVNDPSDGERVVVLNPATEPASPEGWNNQGNGATFTSTIGNNVYAQSNPTGGSAWLNNPRPDPGRDLIFNYPINFQLQPVTYINASTSNLFAWNNMIHDIFYAYGFNEVSGNFQENNWGRGGLGTDAVQANAQDGAGMNNANFATPVDGQRPRMRMYNWNLSQPNRDGDLDVGIIIHEYAHGISTRLTGGPANSNCLGSGEAGGMGEGWGDWFATLIRQRPTYNRTTVFPMGDYAANDPKGIRLYPYSTDFKIDPETYGFINGNQYSGVHAKGEVWCGILWQVYWNFVDDLGFAPDLYEGEGGNNQILQDVVDGLKLQPCNPNFVDARDAIIKADQANYDGANFCRLWNGFAIRGLGVNAVGGRSGATQVKEDFSLPVECENYGPTGSSSSNNEM